MNKIIGCMLCSNTTTIDTYEEMPFWLMADMVAREQNWATARSSRGVFLCCQECYPKAFTLEFGGSVGRLRRKYWKMANHYE